MAVANVSVMGNPGQTQRRSEVSSLNEEFSGSYSKGTSVRKATF